MAALFHLFKKVSPSPAYAKAKAGAPPSAPRTAAGGTGNAKAAKGTTDKAGNGNEQRKEKIMDIKGINALIDNLKNDLEDGLIFTEISSFKIGSSLAGYNMNGKFGALINKYTKYIIEIVNKVGFGTTCEYYAVDLSGNNCMFVLVFDEYCWPILIDTKKVSPGMMVSAVLPDCITAFEKTMK